MVQTLFYLPIKECTAQAAEKCGSSNRCVSAHDEVEYVLNRLEQVLFVVNVDAEFALHSIMHQYARLDVKVVVFIVPVRLESNWHTIPSVGVNLAQTLSATLDAAFCKHVRLLLKMQVVLSRIVKATLRELCSK